MWARAPVLAVFGLAACAPHKAPLVPLVAGGPLSPALYERYRLIGEVGFFSAKWKRADGEYGFAELDQIAAQFPESEGVHQRAMTRATILGIVATTGAVTAGFTLGWNVAASDETRWSTGTQAALYGVGGGLLLTSFVMALAWHNPVEDFADVYNASLRRHLGLPEPAGQGPAPTSFWVPQPIGANGLGWKF